MLGMRSRQLIVVTGFLYHRTVYHIAAISGGFTSLHTTNKEFVIVDPVGAGEIVGMGSSSVWAGLPEVTYHPLLGTSG